MNSAHKVFKVVILFSCLISDVSTCSQSESFVISTKDEDGGKLSPAEFSSLSASTSNLQSSSVWASSSAVAPILAIILNMINNNY